MADQFLDRLREAICEPDYVDTERLKGAATAGSTELDAERGLTLVRVVYGREVAEGAQADLRTRLNAKGNLIGAQGQDQLVAALAAEALIIAFSRTSYNRAMVAALAVRCARHLGWQPVHPDVETHADAYLSHRSVLVRVREPDVPVIKPKPDDPAPAPLTEEVRVLRDLVRKDRLIVQEREAFSWWLLNETRPASPLAIAQELYGLLRYLPEPLVTNEMLAYKLRRQPVPTPTWAVNMRPGVADLCPDLVRAGEEGDGSGGLTAVRRLFDQLQLLLIYPEPK